MFENARRPDQTELAKEAAELSMINIGTWRYMCKKFEIVNNLKHFSEVLGVKKKNNIQKYNSKSKLNNEKSAIVYDFSDDDFKKSMKKQLGSKRKILLK